MTIQDEWKEFEKKVIPKDAGEDQRNDTKKSFFAGALIVFYLMDNIKIGKIPREEVSYYIDNLHEECIEFGKEQIRKSVEKN